MIEQKTRGSVWSIAMLAVSLFVAASLFANVFSTNETGSAIAASAIN